MSALKTAGRCFGEWDDPVAPGTSCVCAQVFAWDTQTANQAVGTGVLVGLRRGWYIRCAWRVVSGLAASFPADQSARIGFGAL